MENRFAATLICIFLCSELWAQAVLKGRVTDGQTGEALTGVNLYLKSDLLKGTNSDVEGFFQLEWNRSSGQSDTLFASHVGYEGKTIRLTTPDSEVLNIPLRPLATQLNPVEIKAKKLIAREFTVREINKLDIYLNPNSKADPLLAVQSLPAATSTDETANLSLRGSPPHETGTYLNNVLIRDAVKLDDANGLGQFSIFNTAMIQSVNVFASNPPLEFGEATSGAVALYTDDQIPAKATSVVATVAGGGLQISRQLKDKTAFTAYSNVGIHPALRALNKKALRNILSFTSTDAGLYVIHRFNDRASVKVFNYSLFENFQFHFRHPSFEVAFFQKKKRNLTIANFNYHLKNGQLEINQSFNWTKANFRTGNFDSNIQNLDYFGSANYHYFRKKWSVKSGISLDWHRIQLQSRFPEFDFALSEQHPSFPFDTLQIISIPEGYFYGKYHFSSKWTFGVGMRFHPALANLESFWSKQINLHYRLKKRHSFTLSIGQYHQFNIPNADAGELFLIQSTHLAFDYRFESEHWTIQSSVYHKKGEFQDLENPIFGAEFLTSFELANLQTSVSLAHIRSSLKKEGVSYPSAYDLAYFLRFLLKYNFPKWFEISLVYQQRPGRYYLPVTGSRYHKITDTFAPVFASPDAGKRLPNYHLLDVSLSRVMPMNKGSLVVFLSANNLLDVKNVRSISYNFDYGQSEPELFNRRVVFFGGVFSWQ